MKRLIDWFSPPRDQVAPTDRDGSRHRKLVSFLLVVLAADLFALMTQFMRGAGYAALGTTLVGVVLMLSLWALRRGAPAWIVTSVALLTGVCVAAVMGIGARANGVGSLFWIVLAPLIALPIGGRRAGWIALLASGTVIVLGLLGIEHHWLEPFMGPERPMEIRMTSLLGVLITSFLLSRAYEIETEASIKELEEKNGALLEAQARADRASQAKSEFLATMSHEIRTPLNGVTGMVTLLADETDPKRMKDGLRIIQQSADTLLKVISDVLDFSKIESNQLELEAVAVSVAHELRLVLQLFESSAAEQGDDLELTVDAGVPTWIVGDPTRLRQVATNLVANAVKFTARGRVLLSARVLEGLLVIDVTDTGIGMSKDVSERLFKPFVQADASTTRRFGGTGLGLVISRRLVEAMGGTLTAQSEPGRGSSFTVKLPFALAEPPRLPEVTVTLAPTRRSVLVVEDNLVNQVVVMRLLEKLGHSVTLANDGEEGLARAAKGHFDVVLMDCHMPVMDGYEATRQLRARGDQTPVFALTAAVTTADREQCFDAGMTGVLSKPLRLEKLSEVLQALPVPADALKTA